MNIYDLQISFGTEIEHKISLNIYLAGCKPNKQCKRIDCHNPILHQFTVGRYYRDWMEQIQIIMDNNIIQTICILGGEPLDQSVDCFWDLVKFLTLYKKPLYLYSGYEQDELPEIHNWLELSKVFKDIKFGPYQKDNPQSQYWLSDKINKQV